VARRRLLVAARIAAWTAAAVGGAGKVERAARAPAEIMNVDLGARSIAFCRAAAGGPTARTMRPSRDAWPACLAGRPARSACLRALRPDSPPGMGGEHSRGGGGGAPRRVIRPRGEGDERIDHSGFINSNATRAGRAGAEPNRTGPAQRHLRAWSHWIAQFNVRRRHATPKWNPARASPVRPSWSWRRSTGRPASPLASAARDGRE
jgi:hypothetical protein